MNTSEDSLRIHNFYLIGKENYELGLNSKKVNLQDNLPPTIFKFRETIQEIGLDIKLEYKNHKYYEENETIVAFEPFHFKDFDNGVLNIWSYFELLFHQWFLYGVSFHTNKIEIYEQLCDYLVNIYGSYKDIPSHDNSSLTVAWFIENPNVSIYLEIEEKGNGERFIVLTYYDSILHMNLNKPSNVYPLIRNESYQKEKNIIHKNHNEGFFSKFFNRKKAQKSQEIFDFSTIKSNVENLLLNDVSASVFKRVSNYITSEITPQNLNLEIGDWLIQIAIKIQENGLFNESELIYNLFIKWVNTPEFVPNKERVELIASVYKNLINVFVDNNKNDNAINSFKQCINTLDNNVSYVNNYNYSFIAGQANYNVARVYEKIGKIDSAIEHGQKALDYFEPFVSPWINKSEISTIILFINNLGNYLYDRGDYEEVLNTYVMGMRFATDNSLYYYYSMFNMNLAITFVKLKKYTDADKQYNILLDLINKEPAIYENTPLKGQVLINMSNMYKDIEDNVKEIEYLTKAVLFYEIVLSEQPQMEGLVNNLKERIQRLNKE